MLIFINLCNRSKYSKWQRPFHQFFSHLIAHNFTIFPLILVKFVLKFMSCKVVYFEALIN